MTLVTVLDQDGTNFLLKELNLLGRQLLFGLRFLRRQNTTTTCQQNEPGHRHTYRTTEKPHVTDIHHQPLSNLFFSRSNTDPQPNTDPQRQRAYRLPVGEVRYWDGPRSYLSVNTRQVLAQTALGVREYQVSRGRLDRQLATFVGPNAARCRQASKLPVDLTVRQRVLQLSNGRRGDPGAQ